MLFTQPTDLKFRPILTHTLTHTQPHLLIPSTRSLDNKDADHEVPHPLTRSLRRDLHQFGPCAIEHGSNAALSRKAHRLRPRLD